MTFEFSLQSLLRVRRSYETRERMNLALLSKELRRRQEDLKDLDRLVGERSGQARASLGQGVLGGEYRIAQSEIEGLKSLRSAAVDKIEEIERHRRAQLSRLVASRKDVRILESLREKRLAAYRIDEDRRGQQRQDDLFNTRRGRIAPLE